MSILNQNKGYQNINYLTLNLNCSLFSTYIISTRAVMVRRNGLFALPSRFGSGLARPAISPSYLKLPVYNRGGKIPCSSWAFLVDRRRWGCARRLDVFRLICIVPNVFYEWRHPHARISSLSSSECRLQTRITIYKCKNASIFSILLTTCFLSRKKPYKDSSSASFS